MQKVFDPHRIFTDLKSEVDIPEQRIGRFEIRHSIIKAGEKIPVVTMRNALFMHYKPLDIILPFDYTVTKLHQYYEDSKNDMDKGTWMTTHPQEIFSSHMVHDAAFGDVLIGGLGLGYSTQNIASKPDVKSVTVVEIEKDVIQIVEPHLHRSNVEVVQDDLYKYLETTKKKFDFCYFDIWASTGERELPKVNKLRELAKRVLNKNGKIMCWMEDEMNGQVKFGEETKKLWENNMSATQKKKFYKMLKKGAVKTK